MDCILHIGTEKTGSTSLQNFLGDNTASLSANGFYVAWEPGEEANRNLVLAFQKFRYQDWNERGWTTVESKDAELAPALENLQARIANAKTTHHTAIMSSEMFHSRLRHSSELSGLEGFLKASFRTVTIVCFLKSQENLRQSLYSSTLRGRQTKNYHSFATAVVKDRGYFDYSALIGRWAKSFGAENLKLAVVDSPDRAQFDTRTFFARSILGLDDEAGLVLRPTLSNRALNYRQVILYRLFNKLTLRRLTPSCQATIRRARNRLAETCLFEGEARIRRTDKNFQKTYDAANRELAKKYRLNIAHWL